MDNEKLLARLTGRLYEAGICADSWDAALDDIMQAIGADVSALFVEDRAHPVTAFEVFSVRGYPEHVPDTYRSYFAERDVRLPAILALPAGQVYADERAMPFAEVERSEIYNDFYRPLGLAHGAAIVPFNDGRRFGVLSAHRAIRAGNFLPTEIATLERLAPHVIRALQLHRQVVRANAVADGLAVALNHFQLATLLVDERGAVIELNLAAEVLLRRSECPLRLVGRHLSAVSADHQAALARAISDAAHSSGGRLSTVPSVLRLAKTDGSAALGVMVTPARQPRNLGMKREGLAIVFISDPGQASPAEPDLLIRQFGLSPAEAQIAVRLTAGDRIEDIADARGVSQETVRVQVKRVLSKTETRSQGQLIGLLSRSLAALRR